MVVSAEEPPGPEPEGGYQDCHERDDQDRVAFPRWLRWCALTGGAVDGLIALLAVSGLLVAGLGVVGLGLLVPGLGVAGLCPLITGLGLLISGLWLLIPRLWLRAAEGRLLGVSLLRTIVGTGPLVVTHSYLLVQHGKRFL